MVDDGGRDLPITAGHQQLSYYLYLTLVHDSSDFPLWANYVSACVRKTVIVFQTCSRFNLSIQCSQQSSPSSGSLDRSTPEDQFVSKCQQHVSRTIVFVVCCCCSACIDIDIHRRFSWVAWGAVCSESQSSNSFGVADNDVSAETCSYSSTPSILHMSILTNGVNHLLPVSSRSSLALPFQTQPAISDSTSSSSEPLYNL